jgi:hypothetical protein
MLGSFNDDTITPVPVVPQLGGAVAGDTVTEEARQAYLAVCVRRLQDIAPGELSPSPGEQKPVIGHDRDTGISHDLLKNKLIITAIANHNLATAKCFLGRLS